MIFGHFQSSSGCDLCSDNLFFSPGLDVLLIFLLIFLCCSFVRSFCIVLLFCVCFLSFFIMSLFLSFYVLLFFPSYFFCYFFPPSFVSFLFCWFVLLFVCAFVRLFVCSFVRRFVCLFARRCVCVFLCFVPMHVHTCARARGVPVMGVLVVCVPGIPAVRLHVCLSVRLVVC